MAQRPRSVEGIDGAGTGSDSFVVGFARGLEFAFLEIEVAQLFVVSVGWVVANCDLKFCDAVAARESLEGVARESDIRERFGKEIDSRAMGPRKRMT